MKKERKWVSKVKKSVCELLYNFIWPETCLIRVPEEEEREERTEKIFEEIMAENLQNLWKL